MQDAAPEEDLLLTTKEVAALMRLSVSTLEHGRSDQPSLAVPAHIIVGTRTVRFRFGSILMCLAARQQRPHWEALPFSTALRVRKAFATRGLVLPVGLQKRLGAG